MSEYSKRLANLRHALAARGADGFFVPIADAHMSEYVSEDAQRLRWLSGFSGSAGLGLVLRDAAALFTDGRYVVQARDETEQPAWEICETPHVTPARWLERQAAPGAVLLYDPWLHTRSWVNRLRAALPSGVRLEPADANLVDALWRDRPEPSPAPLEPHALAFSGRHAADKLDSIAAELSARRTDAAVITALDSVAWALNTRGRDAPFLPVTRAFLLIHADASADLFIDERKVDAVVRAHLGNAVSIRPYEAVIAALQALRGKRVTLDADTSVDALYAALDGAEIVEAMDPCVWPRAKKTPAEIAGARAAHLRDGVAFCKFLHWLSLNGASGIDELEASAHLDSLRRASPLYREPSFAPISAAGPSAALPHYVPKPGRARRLERDQIYLMDSGGQYDDGTTDITRTIVLGAPTPEMRRHFTLALKCHLAVAAIITPPGTTGGQLDPLARQFLWAAGLDYATGTGHGIGTCLSVHEGPVFIGRRGGTRPVDEPLTPGILLTIEPGLYLEGRYGIRTENVYLLVERTGEDGRSNWIGFEPITLAPIDRALIDGALLTPAERAWIDTYHARVLREIGPHLDAKERAWLEGACAPLAA